MKNSQFKPIQKIKRIGRSRKLRTNKNKGNTIKNKYFPFTRTDDEFSMTSQKKKRNKVYIICGIGMIVFEVIQAVTSIVSFFPGWCTMINEIALLQFFGVSWLVKGGAIKILND